MITMNYDRNTAFSFQNTMRILNTDMKSYFDMYTETDDRKTVKKAYYLAGADPK